MAKKPQKTATEPTTTDENETPKPPRRVGDSSCMTSHEELVEQHGEETLKANVEQARKIRSQGR